MNSRRKSELADDLVLTRAVAFVYSKRGHLFSLYVKCCHSGKKKLKEKVIVPGSDICFF